MRKIARMPEIDRNLEIREAGLSRHVWTINDIYPDRQRGLAAMIVMAAPVNRDDVWREVRGR